MPGARRAANEVMEVEIENASPQQTRGGRQGNPEEVKGAVDAIMRSATPAKSSKPPGAYMPVKALN